MNFVWINQAHAITETGDAHQELTQELNNQVASKNIEKIQDINDLYNALKWLESLRKSDTITEEEFKKWVQEVENQLQALLILWKVSKNDEMYIKTNNLIQTIRNTTVLINSNTATSWNNNTQENVQEANETIDYDAIVRKYISSDRESNAPFIFWSIDDTREINDVESFKLFLTTDKGRHTSERYINIDLSQINRQWIIDLSNLCTSIDEHDLSILFLKLLPNNESVNSWDKLYLIRSRSNKHSSYLLWINGIMAQSAITNLDTSDLRSILWYKKLVIKTDLYKTITNRPIQDLMVDGWGILFIVNLNWKKYYLNITTMDDYNKYVKPIWWGKYEVNIQQMIQDQK